MVQDKPMVYEQEDVVDELPMRHGVMQKTIIPLNPQIETGIPEICQLICNITVWIFGRRDV